MRSRDGGDLDQAPGEGRKDTLLLGAQIADLRIHVAKVHFNTWITLKYFNDRCGTGIEGAWAVARSWAFPFSASLAAGGCFDSASSPA